MSLYMEISVIYLLHLVNCTITDTLTFSIASVILDAYTEKENNFAILRNVLKDEPTIIAYQQVDKMIKRRKSRKKTYDPVDYPNELPRIANMHAEFMSQRNYDGGQYGLLLMYKNDLDGDVYYNESLRLSSSGEQKILQIFKFHDVKPHGTPVNLLVFNTQADDEQNYKRYEQIETIYKRINEEIKQQPVPTVAIFTGVFVIDPSQVFSQTFFKNGEQWNLCSPDDSYRMWWSKNYNNILFSFHGTKNFSFILDQSRTCQIIRRENRMFLKFNLKLKQNIDKPKPKPTRKTNAIKTSQGMIFGVIELTDPEKTTTEFIPDDTTRKRKKTKSPTRNRQTENNNSDATSQHHVTLTIRAKIQMLKFISQLFTTIIFVYLL